MGKDINIDVLYEDYLREYESNPQGEKLSKVQFKNTLMVAMLENVKKRNRHQLLMKMQQKAAKKRRERK